MQVGKIGARRSMRRNGVHRRKPGSVESIGRTVWATARHGVGSREKMQGAGRRVSQRRRSAQGGVGVNRNSKKVGETGTAAQSKYGR